MRLPALLSCATLLACASSPAPPPLGAVDRVHVVQDGQLIQGVVDENSRVTIAGPPARVWTALLAAYTELGIEPTVSDRERGHYGNSAFILPRVVRGKGPSHYFSCGSGLAGGFTSTGRVTANVQSVITGNEDGTSALVTHVSGRYRTSEGTSTSAIPCGSTGALEQFIQAEVNKHFPRM